MAKRKNKTASNKKAVSQDIQGVGPAKSAAASIVHGGVRTATEFSTLIEAVIADTIEGHITPNRANVTISGVRLMLRIVDMRYKYAGRAGRRALDLDLITGRVT